MERCTAIERLLGTWYDRLRDPDGEAAADTFAADADTLFVGTDPAEWWTGDTAICGKLSNVLHETGGLNLVQAEPRGFRLGNTAWVSDRPYFRLPDGSEIPVRVTATACRVGAQWRFVALHMSLGLNSHLPPEVIAITSRPLE